MCRQKNEMTTIKTTLLMNLIEQNSIIIEQEWHRDLLTIDIIQEEIRYR